MTDVNTQHAKQRRAARTRHNISGNAERPRLSVSVSSAQVTAQAIDDTSGSTLASSDSKKLAAKGTMTEKAAAVGADIAKQLSAKKVKKVAFDRGAKNYHGRVAALAEAARKAGLEF